MKYGLFVLFALVWPVAAGAAPRYSHSDLKLIGSASPIPDAHVRCMKHLDAHFAWQMEQLGRFRQQFAQENFSDAKYAEHLRADRAKIEDQIAGVKKAIAVDWGVPPKETAEGFIRRYKANIAEDEAALAEARRELSNVDNGSWKSVSAARYYGREMVYFKETVVRQDRAYAAYGRCVIENDLPPTAK